MKPTRAKFLKRGLELMGTPYVWGGRSNAGVDCWGFVALLLRDTSGGELGFEKWWTDKAWMELTSTGSARPGDLAFYGGNGPEDVDHVMIVLHPPGGALPDGMVFGASGGDRHCLTPEDAAERSACVKPFLSVRYRGDFRGYRSMSSFLMEAV